MIRETDPAARYIRTDQTVDQLRDIARSCTACDLHERGTQTVFGEGPSSAAMVLAGEQPGDAEDIAGRPFVGPAGKLLDRALTDAGIDRRRVYVTNVVKHFKWIVRGKKRIHRKPNAIQIESCRPWLDAEGGTGCGGRAGGHRGAGPVRQVVPGDAAAWQAAALRARAGGVRDRASVVDPARPTGRRAAGPTTASSPTCARPSGKPGAETGGGGNSRGDAGVYAAQWPGRRQPGSPRKRRSGARESPGRISRTARNGRKAARSGAERCGLRSFPCR